MALPAISPYQPGDPQEIHTELQKASLNNINLKEAFLGRSIREIYHPFREQFPLSSPPSTSLLQSPSSGQPSHPLFPLQNSPVLPDAWLSFFLPTHHMFAQHNRDQSKHCSNTTRLPPDVPKCSVLRQHPCNAERRQQQLHVIQFLLFQSNSLDPLHQVIKSVKIVLNAHFAKERRTNLFLIRKVIYAHCQKVCKCIL